MSTETKPAIVFCHGIWADGSCFNKVIPALQADGHEVIAAQYGLNNYADDVATIKRTLKRVSGPVILVGHSYGGAVITDAATGDRQVKALVYVDAFIPDKGESLLSILTPKDPSQPGLDPNALFNFVPFPGAPKGVTDWYVKPGVFPSLLANDLPKTEANMLAATQRPIASNALTEQSSAPAWKTIPSWDVIGTEDHVLPPALQLSMARRAAAHITEVKASHLSLISHPGAVAEVVLTAAQHAR